MLPPMREMVQNLGTEVARHSRRAFIERITATIAPSSAPQHGAYTFSPRLDFRRRNEPRSVNVRWPPASCAVIWNVLLCQLSSSEA